VEALEKIPGVKVAQPKGAFYCMAQLPVKDAEHFAQGLLESFSDQGESTMVAPAAGFYSTKGFGNNEVRIAYVLKKEDLIKAVNIIHEALKVYPQ
jgi:aspartate aminotransferase